MPHLQKPTGCPPSYHLPQPRAGGDSLLGSLRCGVGGWLPFPRHPLYNARVKLRGLRSDDCGTRRLALLAIACALGCLAASPAHADMYVPSFVQVLTAPLLWSMFVVTLVVTIPIILIVACIEAIVLRRYTTKRPWWRRLAYLAAVNAVTSLAGAAFLPRGTELWPGLALAFGATVLVETVFLRLFNPGFPEPVPLRLPLKAAFWMNAASYAVMAIALVGLVYGPSVRHENKDLRASAAGTIIVANGTDQREDGPEEYVSVRLGQPQPRRAAYRLFSWLPPQMRWSRARSDQFPSLDREDGGPPQGVAKALSLSPERVRELTEGYDAQLSPTQSALAWFRGGALHVYNRRQDARRVLALPGAIYRNQRFAWSPDGTMIAYLGSLNEFTYQSWAPDLCVVRVTDGAVATLRHTPMIAPGPEAVELLWLQ
jgi:hypothetical protein